MDEPLMPAQPPTFDLQSHSVHSDGALPASEVVAAAAAAGVRLVGLTDHDTVDGVREAVASGEDHGVRVVPAIEISALDQPSLRDLHILGYVIDDRDPQLRRSLRDYRDDRIRRGEAMAAALRELGFELDEESLRRRTRAGASLGRPHLAAAVVGHPANHGRLQGEGRLDASAFLGAYLTEGKPAFRRRERPSVKEAIATIHDAGGVAVWAHPFWDVSDPQEVEQRIEHFAQIGIDGVESFYPTHTRDQVWVLDDAARGRGLLSTGSSDFHGPEHRMFSRFRAFETYGREPTLGPIAG